jgi:putative DNA primase/helicase
VRPGDALPKEIDGARVIDNRPTEDANWGTNGSAKEWQEGIKRFADGQALPTFVLGCAFASIIQHLVPEISDNVGFELVDTSSIGKSSLLLLAASVFGPPQRFRRTWHTTVPALEQTVALRGDALLIQDEVSLFLNSTPDVKKDYPLAIHQLAEGSEKARFDVRGTRNHRFLFLSAANTPVGEVLKSINRSDAEAVEVRMPTIARARGWRVWRFRLASSWVQRRQACN